MTLQPSPSANPKEYWVLWPEDYAADPELAGTATCGERTMSLAAFEKYRQKVDVWAVWVDFKV